METLTTLFADFNNTDKSGRLRLNVTGTIRDLDQKNIVLENGLKFLFSDFQELSMIGVVQFSTDENIWVASLDWNNLHTSIDV